MARLVNRTLRQVGGPPIRGAISPVDVFCYECGASAGQPCVERGRPLRDLMPCSDRAAPWFAVHKERKTTARNKRLMIGREIRERSANKAA